MINMFLTNLPEAERQKVLAGANCLEMEIDGASGLVIDGTETEAVLKLLGKKITDNKETSLAGIYHVTLADRAEGEAAIPPTIEAEDKDKVVELNLTDETQSIIIRDNDRIIDPYWRRISDKLMEFLPLAVTEAKRIIIHLPNRIPQAQFEDLLEPGALHIVIGRDVAGSEPVPFASTLRYSWRRKIICAHKWKNPPDNYEDRAKLILEILLAAAFTLADSQPEIDRRLELIRKISCDSWNSYAASDSFRLIAGICLEQFLPDRQIIIDVPHRSSQSPFRDNNFRIHIWSTPDGEAKIKPPQQLWGYNVDCRDWSYLPSGQGISLVADNGYSAAELVGNDLYIHHDLCHHGRNSEYLIFWRILQEALPFVPLAEAERSQLDEQRQVVEIVDSLYSDKAERFIIRASALAKNKLLPRLKEKRIQLHFKQDHFSQEPFSDGKFHILLLASPGNNPYFEGCGDRRVPEKIWGRKFGNVPNYASSGLGADILDDSGFTVAELVRENNLYILLPLHWEIMEEAAMPIFERIIDELLIEINLDQSSRANREAERKTRLFQAARQAYLAECGKRYQNEIKRLEQSLANINEQCEQYQKALVNTLRTKDMVSSQLRSLEAGGRQNEQAVLREFEALWNMPGIERIAIADNLISIFTEPIFITVDKTKRTYDIGKFRVDIHTDGSQSCLRMFNLTRKGRGPADGFNVQHPHVRFDGLPCLGNISEVVGQLLANYEISALTQLCLQFLKTVNLGDPSGSMINDYWPLATDQAITAA